MTYIKVNLDEEFAIVELELENEEEELEPKRQEE